MDIRAIGMGVFFAVMWASAFTSTRMIVTEAPPLFALALRFAMSGAAAFVIALAMGETWRALTRAQWRAVVILGLCQNALYLGLNWVAMQWIEAGLASIIAATMPLIVAMLGWSLFGERLRGRATAPRPMSSLTPVDALVVGVWQCGALIPGISRSGATIVGGLLRGVSHEGAARFSFLIATPIILGATVLEVPKLLHAAIPPGTFGLSVLAAAVAGVTAWLSTAFLTRYFREHEAWALNPFAYYCLLAGLGSLAWLLLG